MVIKKNRTPLFHLTLKRFHLLRVPLQKLLLSFTKNTFLKTIQTQHSSYISRMTNAQNQSNSFMCQNGRETITSTTSANLKRCGPRISRRVFTKKSKIECEKKRKLLEQTKSSDRSVANTS